MIKYTKKIQIINTIFRQLIEKELKMFLKHFR